MAELVDVAKEIFDAKERINLIYAFNATGKTRLSVAYKELPDNGFGLCYNAYSEDLFVWDNDRIELTIQVSSLNQYHTQLSEEILMEKLAQYNPKYGFCFNYNENMELGIASISFFVLGDENQSNIKISRAEERIFIWCFFLSLLDLDYPEASDKSYVFIDDPISSVDEHNLYITIFSIIDLISKYCDKYKFIITTHHLPLASVLWDWLSKGEKCGLYKKKSQLKFLERSNGGLDLLSGKNGTMLYHLKLMQVIKKAIQEDSLEIYHFAMLRQIIENVSSFFGAHNASHILRLMGYSNDECEQKMVIINSQTHKKEYYPQINVMAEDNVNFIKEIISGFENKLGFVF